MEATVKTLDNDLFINDVVNIGGDKVVSVLELANQIISLTGSSSKIEFLPPLPEGDMTRRQPDNSKMLRILNRDLITLEEGLKKTMDDPHFIRQLNAH